jgi:ABC-type oligopeptide transport system ATPase subunit
MNNIELRNVNVLYPQKKSFLKKSEPFIAAKNISFTVKPGETVSLVGESGSGKTSIAKAITLLADFTGEIFVLGKKISPNKRDNLSFLRKNIQMIFQDPYSSLNPRLSAYETIHEVLKVHDNFCTGKSDDKIKELFDMVKLPENLIYRYPHQLSGGQRQRIGIARAFAVEPKLIICDESVAALDVRVQSQILKLLQEIQTKKNISYLFISHDLAVVENISNNIIVLNNGEIVEKGTPDEICYNPTEEYTKKLLSAVPYI